jgi:type IV secretion system protein VirD4
VSGDLVPDEGRFERRALASASLVSQEQLQRQGYAQGDFWLGRSLNGSPVGWNEEMNLLTCAGPGAGKGVSVVVPNLLEFPGSAVVVDPKGELATLTAAYRRDVLGQKVIVLDPTNTAEVPDELRGTYNPFDQIDPTSPSAVTAAQTIAQGLIVPNPKSQDAHFEETALDLVQSCILYMLAHYPAAERTLMSLRKTLAMGDSRLFEAYVARQRESDPDYMPDPEEAYNLFIRAMFDTPNYHGVIAETATKIGRMGDRERGSVFSTATRQFDFLTASELWSVLESNDDPRRTFQLRELRRQDRPLTVYLCLPIDMMPRQGRWFRVIFSQVIQFIERSRFNKEKDHPILLMMDEFFQLGPLPTIANTLTYARSFGLRLWLVVQDLNQIKANYPEQWETILGACGIKQFFGVNDMFTAKYISEMIGHQEINVPSISISETYSDALSQNSSETESENRNLTVAHAVSKSEGDSTSVSQATNWNNSEGKNAGTNVGASINYNHAAHPSGSGLNTGVTTGGSTGSSSGTNASVSTSSGHGGSLSETYSRNRSTTVSQTVSESEGTSQSRTIGHGSTFTSGKNYAFSVSKQTRAIFRPEDVLTAFTQQNVTQLVHVRDQGGMLLFRTPFFADPFFRMRLEEHQALTAAGESDVAA